MIDASSNLRSIATMSVGYDHIDLDAADDRDIAVGHTPVPSPKRLLAWVGRS